MNPKVESRTRTNSTTATSMRQTKRSLKRAVCAVGMSAHTLVGFLCLILLSPSAYAQYSSGVDGTVLDSSGAVIAGATIQLTNVDLGVSKIAKNDNAGYFRIDSIAAGSYKLTISAPSFKTWTQTGLVLEVGQIRTVAPQLEPGTANTVVTVSALQAAVNLTNARTDAVIGEQTVVEVPLVGQNVYALAALAPGVTGPGLSSGDNFNNQYGIQINAAGQRQESNSFMIDGAFVDTPSLGGEASVSPNPEIVQSVQVTTNDFDAEKGRTSGAITEVFTKSGTNNFHGTGDYFFLDDRLTSRSEFESTVPAYTRQEMGATLGGPIFKNKLFGFGAIDVLRSSTINSSVTTVETQDFANYVESNFNTIGSGYFKLAPPQSYATTGVETVAQYEALYPGYFPPPPNIPANLPAIGTINYSQSAPRNGDQWSFRIDEYYGQHDRFYGTVARTAVNSAPAGVRINLANDVQQDTTLVNLGWTHTFSSHLLNEAGISFVRPSENEPPLSSAQVNGFPDVSVEGVNISGPYSGAWAQKTLGFRDTLTDTIKSHVLKVGLYLESAGHDYDPIPAREDYSFNNLLDFIQDKPTTEQGLPINLTTDQAVTPVEGYIESYYSFFVQDDWKVRRNLTINAGIRYDSGGHLGEILSPPFSLFNFGSGTTREGQIGNGSVSLLPKGDDNQLNHIIWQISPRVGFSWDIFGDGRTALRGGFGLFSDRLPYRNTTGLVEGNLPVTYTPSLSVYSGQTPVMNTCTETGYFVSCPLLIPSNIVFNSHGGIVGQRASIGGWDPNTKLGQIENWTLSVQRQLSNDTTVQLNYSGLASHNLPITTDINRFNDDLIINKGSLARLNPSFGSINYETTDGNSAGTMALLC
jgi:Carboxypeptidase regulatory-like domain